MKTYPFSLEGLEKAKQDNKLKLIKISTSSISSLAVVLAPNIVYAKDLNTAGWQFVSIARTGLFWVCMFTAFYGLYIMVLKKDGMGKKIIVTSLLTYLGSWIIPEGFLLIQSTFSK